jgi:uncharacterized small protein (TIGR04563 family)
LTDPGWWRITSVRITSAHLGYAGPTTLFHKTLESQATMAGTDKRKQSLYFPEEMLREIQEEATRQDRSLSWVVQQAWRIARERIKAFPAVNDVTGEPALPDTREEA